MKKFLLLFLFSVITVAAQRPFITKWYTGNGYFTIPASGQYSYTYQLVGSPTTFGPFNAQDQVTISAEQYKECIVSITPTGSFKFTNAIPQLNDYTTNSTKLYEVMQWGDVQWHSDLRYMFSGATSMIITATDIPDFSNVYNMDSMFRYCSSLNTVPNMNNWDVSNVTNMNEMFRRANSFNQDIGNWNVSKVTNMMMMFKDAWTFNQDIGNWNVSNVYLMYQMFSDAWAFDQNIGNWNTSKVIDMIMMFNNAKAFNQNIGNWNVSNVEIMQSMFQGATAFNQDIGNWDVSNVVNMGSMFQEATAFNQDIGNWNVSNVVTMESMFQEATAFNQDIGNWNVSNVVSMKNMFPSNTTFNQDISKWDTSKVYDMSNMFNGTTSFNQDLGNWNISNIANMEGMFNTSGLSCQNYALTLKGWAEKPTTPLNILLGAQYVRYGSNGIIYKNFLENQKGWTIRQQDSYYDPNCSDVLATQENSLNQKLKIYPNPTTGIFFYEAQTEELLQISSTTGQLLKTIKVSKGNNQINLSELPKGVYFLKAGNKTSKLIKN